MNQVHKFRTHPIISCDLGELAEQAELSGRKDMKQSKGAARLFSRVNKMLKNIDGVVGKLEVSHIPNVEYFLFYEEMCKLSFFIIFFTLILIGI